MERAGFGKENKGADFIEKYIWAVHKEQKYIFQAKFISIRQKFL